MNTTIITIGRFHVTMFCCDSNDPAEKARLKADAQRIIQRWAASGGYDHRDQVSVGDE